MYRRRFAASRLACLFVTFIALSTLVACAGSPVESPLHKLEVDAYEKHEPQAILQLAHLFVTGTGGEVYNLEKAWDLYIELGVKGDPEAQLRLGDMCFFSFSDYSCALSWFQKSADQGNDVAKQNVEYMHKWNMGTPDGVLQADEFYRTAQPITEVQKTNLDFVTNMKKMIGIQGNFSRAAHSARAGGIATVQFEYTGGGKATDVSIYKSSGSDFEDQSAVEAVEKADLPERPSTMSNIHHYLIAVNFNRPY
jgi:TonB family protein